MTPFDQPVDYDRRPRYHPRSKLAMIRAAEAENRRRDEITLTGLAVMLLVAAFLGFLLAAGVA